MLPPSETTMTVLVAKSQISVFTRSSIGASPIGPSLQSKPQPAQIVPLGALA
jgi:hypothetical protein